MALEHVLAELGNVIGAEGLFAGDDAGNLGGDVIGAFEFALGQLVFGGENLFWLDGAEVFYAEFARGGFAVVAEFLVFAADQGVFYFRISDHHGDARERRMTDGE